MLRGPYCRERAEIHRREATVSSAKRERGPVGPFVRLRRLARPQWVGRVGGPLPARAEECEDSQRGAPVSGLPPLLTAASYQP
jgi:hypothetical protein